MKVSMYIYFNVCLTVEYSKYIVYYQMFSLIWYILLIFIYFICPIINVWEFLKIFQFKLSYVFDYISVNRK